MPEPPPQSGPPARQRTSLRTRLYLGIGAVVVVSIILAVVTFGPARDTGTSNLGDDVFEVGRTERLAAEVAERGPFFVQDLVGGGRDLWVQHVGNDPETGWLALGVIIPGDGPRCLALWDTGTEQFESDCDDRVFPPDGTGLTQYPVTIEDGNVLVDINFEARDVPDDPGS